MRSRGKTGRTAHQSPLSQTHSFGEISVACHTPLCPRLGSTPLPPQPLSDPAAPLAQSRLQQNSRTTPQRGAFMCRPVNAPVYRYRCWNRGAASSTHGVLGENAGDTGRATSYVHLFMCSLRAQRGSPSTSHAGSNSPSCRRPVHLRSQILTHKNRHRL